MAERAERAEMGKHPFCVEALMRLEREVCSPLSAFSAFSALSASRSLA
jgi:hypothetical protein